MKSITLKFFVLAALLISPACSKSSKPTKPPDVDYYTCTMHPSVHAEAPGKCPICGMDLVPVMKKNSGLSPSASAPPSGGAMQGMAGMPGMQTGNQTGGTTSHEFVVPVERQQQIGVTYATVTRGPLHHTIRAVGMVEPDMQKHWAFVARVDGYVQELFVPSAGQVVEKDAPLMSIYSPDLFTTERELVMLLRMHDEAKENLAAAEHELERTDAESLGALRDALEKVHTMKHHVDLFRDKLVPQARQAFEANQFTYETGKASFLEWITAQRNLRDLEATAQQHIADYYAALAELEAVVGADLNLFPATKTKERK